MKKTVNIICLNLLVILVGLAINDGLAIPRFGGFQSECIRLGDTQIAYANIEFSPSGKYMSWASIHTPRQGYPVWNQDFWITGVNSIDGTLVPSDGRDYLATEGVPWGTFAYWGEDANGEAAYTGDNDNRIIRILIDDQGVFQRTVLTSPLDRRPQYVYASRLPDERTTYLVYLKEIKVSGSDERWFEIFWMDASQPTVEHQLMINGKPYIYSESFYTNPRWVPGKKLFVFPIRQQENGGFIQVGVHHVITGQSWLVTTDAGDKIDPFPFVSVQFPDEWLLAAVVDWQKIIVYRPPTEGQVYDPYQVIDLPSPYKYEQSAEFFEWEGKTYLSAGVNRSPSGYRLFDPGSSRLSQLWVADIDGTTTRKVSTNDVRWAIDAETLKTDTGIYVYGYQRASGEDYQGLWKCKSGFGN